MTHRAALFLLCTLNATALSAQPQVFRAAVTISVQFPASIRAPVAVKLLEPADGTLTPAATGRNNYLVTRNNPFSHVLLEVSASGFRPVIVNTATTRVFDWGHANDAEAGEFKVPMTVDVIPDFSSLTKVQGTERREKALRLEVFNPFDHEL